MKGQFRLAQNKGYFGFGDAVVGVSAAGAFCAFPRALLAARFFAAQSSSVAALPTTFFLNVGIRLDRMICLLGCGLRSITQLNDFDVYFPFAEFPAGRFTGQENVQLSALYLASCVCHNVLSRITARPRDFDSRTKWQYVRVRGSRRAGGYTHRKLSRPAGHRRWQCRDHRFAGLRKHVRC